MLIVILSFNEVFLTIMINFNLYLQRSLEQHKKVKTNDPPTTSMVNFFLYRKCLFLNIVTK